jgi:nucleobase:cation symporter-1, NCS1 family
MNTKSTDENPALPRVSNQAGEATAVRGKLVESRSIDYIPWKERHGKVWHQGPFWFTSNFVLLTLAVGFTGPLAGLGLGWSALAILLGAGIATFFMAFHANQGPGMGIPQMIQSRAQFGTRGVIIALIPALIVYIGFNVFDVAMATQGFKAVGAPGPNWAWFVGIIAVQALIAIIGYDMIHLVQRWLTYLLMVAFTILGVGSIIALGGTRVLTMGPFNAVAFFSQFVAVAGYQISYAVYVSDYSRYLPARTRLGPLVLWTYCGAALSAVWLMMLGALFTLHMPNGSNVTVVMPAGNMVAPGFGSVVMLLSAIALLTVVAVNTYGATLVSLTAVDGFRPLQSSRLTRIIATASVSIPMLLLVLMVPERYQSMFNDLLAFILYFLVPWSAINLVDYYFVRRGRYSVIEIFNPASMYGRWGWRGLTAYLLGFLAMVPFFALPFYTGPGARALGNIDISIIFGLVVSGLVYYGLARSLDVRAEDRAYRESLATLEPDATAAAPAATETAAHPQAWGPPSVAAARPQQ